MFIVYSIVIVLYSIVLDLDQDYNNIMYNDLVV